MSIQQTKSADRQWNRAKEIMQSVGPFIRATKADPDDGKVGTFTFETDRSLRISASTHSDLADVGAEVNGVSVAPESGKLFVHVWDTNREKA